MSSATPDPRIIRFGAYELDTESGELRKQGRKTRLTPQAFQFLVLLLENRGRLVTREALREKLWPADTFVDFDMGLSSAVKKVREALGDSAENPRFVETLPRRGYRFIASVEAPPAPEPEAGPAEERTAEAEPSNPTLPASVSRTRAWSLAAAAAALVGAAALAGHAGALRSHGAFGGTEPGAIKSIAVLPLANLSGDHSQDYLADGMTDALITELAQIRSLHVVSRTSVMRYQGSTQTVDAIARELGVDALVEGTVARVGQRVRITAQLIDGPTDRHLWARSYEREMRDVLSLQADIATAIAEAVSVEIRPEERRLARAVDPEAYEAYLKGRFFWTARQTDGLFKAADQFQRAIDKDPDYAAAYSGLSDTYRLFDLQGLMRPAECMPKAEAAARRALALDEGLAEAHVSLATVLFRYRWDWAGAESEYQRALELDPGYAEGHRAYAVYLLVMHRNVEALAEAQRARALSPLSPIINTELAFALLGVGRVDEAIAQLERTRALDPDFARLPQSLAIAYGRKGDFARAIAVLEQRAKRPAAASSSVWLGYFYAAGGRKDEARAILRNLEKRAREQYVSPQNFAVLYLGLGDKRQAIAWLDKAYQERAIEWLGFATEMTEGLRDEPGFQALERRLGLPTSTVMARATRRAARPGA